MSRGPVASSRALRGALLAASLLLVAACSGGGDDASSTTSTTEGPPKVTVPGTVAPGEGWLSLETDTVHLSSVRCSGADETSTSQTTQKLYEVVATGTSGDDEVTVTASEFRTDSGDAKATTQTVEVATGSGESAVGVEARRSFFNERWVDLNDPSAKTPLLERVTGQVTATGKFGPQGSRVGDKGIVDGAFVARCPEGGGG